MERKGRRNKARKDLTAVHPYSASRLFNSWHGYCLQESKVIRSRAPDRV